MKLFVKGRKEAIEKIQRKLTTKNTKRIWVHAASLGEYEQAVPVMQGILERHPNYEIVVSFFSPSGYQVKKNNPYAELTTYLPLDTTANAKKFIKAVQPDLVLFIKYEIWPNYLTELKKNNIPVYLVSANFRENQFLFHPLGKFMFNALKKFDHIFVQHQASLDLLKKKGISQASVSGDTRFDRVYQQLAMQNNFAFAEEFKQQNLCMVCGSTWPEDEELLLKAIAQNPNLKFIIAPHEVDKKRIDSLAKKLNTTYALHSNYQHTNLKEKQVLIIDNIGLLSQLYAYADLAYVGGAAGHTGLHNILEPATFGTPIIIGKNFSKFPEATTLMEEKALYSVETQKQLNALVKKLAENNTFREKTGNNAFLYIIENTGATQKILDKIDIRIS